IYNLRKCQLLLWEDWFRTPITKLVCNGGFLPLLKLLDSENGPLKHNAAFVLYGLADIKV
ncbi:hypothetical protein MKW98_027699, partial [Papaver atlanticum]